MAARVRRAAGIAAVLALLLPGPALATEAAGRLTMAETEAEQVEAQFRQALLAIDAGRHQDAVDLLDAILANHPELVRVRLELARALFLKGDEDGRATFQFERVLAGDLPEAVRLNVDRFLDAMRARRTWTLTGGIAIVPDSNINSGPASREVTIGGLPFQLSENATEQSGVGLQASLGGTYRIALGDRFRLQMGGSVFQKVFDEDRFNDAIAQWSIGPRYLLDRGEVGVAFVGYYRLYGNDPYALAAGARLDGNYLLTDRLRLEAGVQLRSLDYHDADYLDGETFDTDVTLRYAVSPTVLTYATALFAATDTRLKTQRNDSRGLALGAYVDLPAGISLGLSVRYAETGYHGIQQLFARKREDEDWQESVLLLHRDVKLLGATPTFRYTRVDHSSSIDVYEYPRDLFEIGLTRQF